MATAFIITVKDGRFEFGNQLKAKVTPYQGDSIRMVFESFKKELQEATGIKVSSTQKEAKARIILDLNPQLPAEAYKLNVSKKNMVDREIAEYMNMARRTVNTRRQKAYRLLKELMGGEADD